MYGNYVPNVRNDNPPQRPPPNPPTPSLPINGK